MAQLFDYPAIIATQDNQRLPLTAGTGLIVWGQVYTKAGNVGTVWMGGASVAQDRGIPLYPNATMFLPAMSQSPIQEHSVYFFFEKTGDIAYVMAAKQ